MRISDWSSDVCSSDLLVPAADVGGLAAHTVSLSVNGKRRQHGALTDLIWTVPDILHELSRLYVLRAGDLVFMGTPAGVGPLQPGAAFLASLHGVATLQENGRASGRERVWHSV